MNAVHVPGLGTFRREEQRTPGGALVAVHWEAVVEWHGEKLALSLYEDGPALSPGDVTRAGQGLLAFLKREEDARREVATALLARAAEWWAARGRGAGEPSLTLERFLSFLRPRTLMVYVTGDDDGHTVFYDDGGRVFAGHTVQAIFDAEGKLIHTDIPG